MDNIKQPSEENIFIHRNRIEQRLEEIGRQISADYGDKHLTVVGVLKGSFIFVADLLRQITTPLQVDFIGLSSYKGTESTNIVKITKELGVDIKGRDILIVEDIIDTGTTISFLIPYLKQRGPSSIKVCSFLTKPGAKKVDYPLDYFGFQISNEFVVGYGLDYNEQYRGLPHVYQLNNM